MKRAERREGMGIRRGLGAVGKKLMRREVVYPLVCKEKDDRLVSGLEVAEWRKKEKP